MPDSRFYHAPSSSDAKGRVLTSELSGTVPSGLFGTHHPSVHAASRLRSPISRIDTVDPTTDFVRRWRPKTHSSGWSQGGTAGAFTGERVGVVGPTRAQACSNRRPAILR